eukprot:TRINITY_DN7751_c0_g1_i1.p1 TRINITY_DN7751_c0_g1~~TRINITY_DN7751_c0_g1_i1.p1  ORF type:complete len:143 (+),score=29.59 TRINITY_DN7751_c0_g1_i1:321-749(+)
MQDLHYEVNESVRECQPFVEEITAEPNQSPGTPLSFSIHAKTLEGYIVEIIASEKGYEVESTVPESVKKANAVTVFETLPTLFHNISPLYRDRVGQSLFEKLMMIQNEPRRFQWEDEDEDEDEESGCDEVNRIPNEDNPVTD